MTEENPAPKISHHDDASRVASAQQVHYGGRSTVVRISYGVLGKEKASGWMEFSEPTCNTALEFLIPVYITPTAILCRSTTSQSKNDAIIVHS